MAVAHTRVVVDGLLIRAVKAEVPTNVKCHPVKSAYPLKVDGILRGYLVNQQPGWRSHSHRGWAIHSLMPEDETRPDGTRRVVATGWTTPDHILRRNVPTLIADGRLPTEAEAAPLIAGLFRKREEWIAGEPDRQAEAARLKELNERHAAEARARREQDRKDTIEGIQSVMDRLRTQLTNFEADALAKALKIVERT